MSTRVDLGSVIGPQGPAKANTIVKVLTTTIIVKNTNYTVSKYTLNNNSLSVFFEGCKLIKDINYIEVDTTHIQFKDWDVPANSNLEFLIN